MKNNRHGKAEFLKKDYIDLIRKHLPTPRDRLIFAIGLYTGERWGAILKLDVKYVYRDCKNSVPQDEITFPASTRKGKRDTRQVFVHPALKELLQAYQPPITGWLFPSPKNPEHHLDFSTADKMLRQTLERAGLQDKGISTHSTRLTFITTLHETGYDLHTIQQLTGHRSLACLAGYIVPNGDRLKTAIKSLPSLTNNLIAV